MSDVLVIGASILDIKGRLTEQPIPNSSNYASIKMSIGGVARNIAENLARLGADARLLTAIGDDYAGEEMGGNAEEVGMDISRALMIDGESTATYLAALDQTGDLLLGLDDTDIMRHITPEYLRKNEDAFEDCEMVVLDLNLTDAALDEAIKTARQYGKKIVVDPTSTQRAVRLKSIWPIWTSSPPTWTKPPRYWAAARPTRPMTPLPRRGRWWGWALAWR